MTQTYDTQFDAGTLPAPESLNRNVAESVRREPARLFENRRRWTLLVLGFILTSILLWFVSLCSRPMYSLEGAFGSVSSPTPRNSVVAAVSTSVLGIQSVVATPTPVTSVLQSLSSGSGSGSSNARDRAVPVSGMVCRAVSATEIKGVSIPAGALVRVTGFSYAGNGHLEISDPPVGWSSAVYFTCPPDVVNLEKPYYVTVPTVRSVSTPAPAAVRVVTVVVPAVTVLPPRATPVPDGVNGVLYDPDSDCVTFLISGVRAIYVDGKPATGGSRHCRISSFTVVIR